MAQGNNGPLGSITPGSAQATAQAGQAEVDQNAAAAIKFQQQEKMIADWQNAEKAAIQGAA